MNAKYLSLIGRMLALAACNDDEETPTLKLDLTIDCVCDLNAELMEFEVKSDGTQVYSGTLGGEIDRAVTDSDGSGIALEPFLFDDIEVHVKANDSVYLHWPGNLNTDIDFYDEIPIQRRA